MCTGRFLLIYEEHMPPGAASGGQRGARKAVASATLWQGGVGCRSVRLRTSVVRPVQSWPLPFVLGRIAVARYPCRALLCVWSFGCVSEGKSPVRPWAFHVCTPLSVSGCAGVPLSGSIVHCRTGYDRPSDAPLCAAGC